MSDLKLVIGNKNYSSWSLRPWLFLKTFDIPFDEEMVFLYEKETQEQVRPYFSNGKVPVLVDSEKGEDFRVWDSLAIIEYVNDMFLNQQGWPKDMQARAVARAVSAEMHSGFFALRNSLGMDCKKHFPNHPVPTDVQQEMTVLLIFGSTANKIMEQVALGYLVSSVVQMLCLPQSCCDSLFMT